MCCVLIHIIGFTLLCTSIIEWFFFFQNLIMNTKELLQLHCAWIKDCVCLLRYASLGVEYFCNGQGKMQYGCIFKCLSYRLCLVLRLAKKSVINDEDWRPKVWMACLNVFISFPSLPPSFSPSFWWGRWCGFFPAQGNKGLSNSTFALCIQAMFLNCCVQ